MVWKKSTIGFKFGNDVLIMAKGKREQILKAASECFARFGYKKTTLDDIGKIIGLNKTSIYYYFESKEEIYIAIVTNEFKQLTKKMYEEIEEDMPCDQKIMIYFEKRHQWWFQKSILLSPVTKDEVHTFIAFGKDKVRKIEQEEKAKFANILKKCIERGQIKECDVEETTKFIFALADGIKSSYRLVDTMRPVTKTESDSINADVQSALKIFINGLR